MYQHTQLGTVIVGGLVLALIFTLWFGVKTLWHPISTILLAVLVSLLPLFYSLTVEVTQDAIHCSFGIGLISRTIPISNIETAQKVKNPWYLGWGIQYVPGGWMFNVSGFDAIALQFKSGHKFRIGTDDPVGLLSAIEQAKRES